MKEKIKKIKIKFKKLFSTLRKKLKVYNLSELNKIKSNLEESIERLKVRINQDRLKKEPGIEKLFERLYKLQKDYKKIKLAIQTKNTQRKYILFGKRLYDLIFEYDIVNKNITFLYKFKKGRDYTKLRKTMADNGFNTVEEHSRLLVLQKKISNALTRRNNSIYCFMNLQTV